MFYAIFMYTVFQLAKNSQKSMKKQFELFRFKFFDGKVILVIENVSYVLHYWQMKLLSTKNLIWTNLLKIAFFIPWVFLLAILQIVKMLKKYWIWIFEWLKVQIMLLILFQPKKVQISGETGKGVGGMISSHPGMIVI